MEDHPRFKTIRGIVDFDKVSEILMYLVEQSETQSKVIGDLQRSLLSHVNNQHFSEKMESIMNGFEKLNSRLDAIQLAATATVEDKT